MSQPTLMDLFNLLTKCAQKSDIDEIKSSITTCNIENAEKINAIDARVDDVIAINDRNTDKIVALEINLEILKQEQLKNNISISGVPPSIINSSNNNTPGLVIDIAKSLNVQINASHFTSYAVAGNKFIIVHFYNLMHKSSLKNKIRAKKSLMVEEVFNGSSNSQIYLNDHLTPYFNSLYLTARKAKADKKLASASSYGGKIRVRKRANDAPVIITSASQLQVLTEQDTSKNTSFVSISSRNDSAETAQIQANINQSQATNKINAKSRISAPNNVSTAAGTSGTQYTRKTAAKTQSHSSQHTHKRKLLTDDKADDKMAKNHANTNIAPSKRNVH